MAISVLAMLGTVVRGGPGELDTTFGTGGKVVTDFGNFSEIADMTVLLDGKILVAGSA